MAKNNLYDSSYVIYFDDQLKLVNPYDLKMLLSKLLTSTCNIYENQVW